MCSESIDGGCQSSLGLNGCIFPLLDLTKKQKKTSKLSFNQSKKKKKENEHLTLLNSTQILPSKQHL